MSNQNHAIDSRIVAIDNKAYVWNQETITALRKNVSRFIRTDSNGDNVYLTIRLAIPTHESGYGDTYKNRQESSMVLTDSGYVNVAAIGDTQAIAFELTIESIGTSEFTNNTLQHANGVQREKRSTCTVFVGSDVTGKIESIAGFQAHLDYNPPMTDESGNVAYMITSHMNRAKSDKSAQQWAKRNGQFVDKR